MNLQVMLPFLLADCDKNWKWRTGGQDQPLGELRRQATEARGPRLPLEVLEPAVG
jgi:hypothetical protein